MGSKLSIDETLAYLETQIAHHRTQHELHAKQEAFHAEQKGIHESELGKAVERFNLLKAASDALGDMVVDVKPAAPAPAPPPADVPTSGWRWLSRLMSLVLESKAPDEVFGASTIADEILERWGSKLKHGVDPRSVGSTLRRWAAEGEILQVREGRAYHEALYTKQRQSE